VVLKRMVMVYPSDFMMEMKGTKLELTGDYDFRFIFDHDALNDIDVELSKIPEDKREGVARSFLAASAMYCMSGALYYMLRARGVDVNGISATSSVKMGKDDKGKSWVEGLNLDIHADIPDESRDVLDHCVNLLKDGCLVTRSLKKGIRVNHTISHSSNFASCFNISDNLLPHYPNAHPQSQNLSDFKKKEGG
jgi:organic hydroperoxide reductase OsmC/OhrA